jgi:hypothetical protein
MSLDFWREIFWVGNVFSFTPGFSQVIGLKLRSETV